MAKKDAHPYFGWHRDWLKRHNLWKDEQVLARNTCVINSLESIAGAPAPDAIRIKRIRDMKSKATIEMDTAISRAIHDRSFVIQVGMSMEEQYDIEIASVKNLIRDAQRSRTPMGEALRQRPFRVYQWPQSEVIAHVRDEEDVMVVGRFIGLPVAHAAHAGFMGVGLYDRVSWLPLFFPKNEPVRSFIFAKAHQST